MALTIETAGRRLYVLGDTYPIRDRLRDAGCKWDPERRAWWGGASKREALDALVGSSEAQAAARPREQSESRDELLAADSKIAGKARYKGREYILVWEGETRRGRACKLAFRDGSRVFWAASAQCEVTRRYESRPERGMYGRETGRMRHMTFGRLERLRERYAEAKRQGYDDGIPDGQRYECEECGEYVTRGGGSCWETGCAH